MCDVTPAVEIDLPLDARAAGEARAFLRRAACSEHQAEVIEDAELLVSELVSNGLRHAAPPLKLRVRCDGGRRLLVSVSDGSPADLAPHQAADSAESGRGLTLVDYISQEWGVENTEDGKVVWFSLAG